MTGSAVHLPHGPHFAGVDAIHGVGLLRPEMIRQMAAGMMSVVQSGNLMLVLGSPGAGKSFGVARGLEHVLERLTVVLNWVDLHAKAQGYQLLREVREQIVADGRSWEMKPPDVRRERTPTVPG